MFLFAVGEIPASSVAVMVANPHVQTAGQLLMIAGGTAGAVFVLWNRRRTRPAVKLIRQRHVTDVPATNSDPTTAASGGG